MDWQTRLIETYLMICELWDQGVCMAAQRFSNNQQVDLTDEEIITIYVYGIISGRSKVKEIYQFTNDYLRDWFPNFKNYEAFNHRLNQLSDAFIALADALSKRLMKNISDISNMKLIDSLPIVMASSKRSSSAKVAPDMASKGYCDSKKMYFYGVKVHVLGIERYHSIPFPEYILLTQASCHDLTAFKEISHYLSDCDVFGDKAYLHSEMQKDLKREKNIQVSTPIKRKKGQTSLDFADKLYSTAVSRIRQPIEAFFNWINEKTSIQIASKVRSKKGLLVHIFGKLSAGMLMFKF